MPCRHGHLFHFTSLHFTSLHFTSLHYTSLHFTNLHFTSRAGFFLEEFFFSQALLAGPNGVYLGFRVLEGVSGCLRVFLEVFGGVLGGFWSFTVMNDKQRR